MAKPAIETVTIIPVECIIITVPSPSPQPDSGYSVIDPIVVSEQINTCESLSTVSRAGRREESFGNNNVSVCATLTSRYQREDKINTFHYVMDRFTAPILKGPLVYRLEMNVLICDWNSFCQVFLYTALENCTLNKIKHKTFNDNFNQNNHILLLRTIYTYDFFTQRTI